jgi:steroid delta-isomerase-like uncharacterized protein
MMQSQDLQDTHDNKALVLRFYDELWNKGNGAAAYELVAPDNVRHDLRPGNAPPGPEGQKLIAEIFRTAFPNLHINVDAVVAEGDTVVARWTMRGTHEGAWAGVPPTGKHISFSGVNFFRITGGKITEIWNFRDDLGLREQLGVPIYAGYPEQH